MLSIHVTTNIYTKTKTQSGNCAFTKRFHLFIKNEFAEITWVVYVFNLFTDHVFGKKEPGKIMWMSHVLCMCTDPINMNYHLF